MTDMYLISRLFGAGKTTLIQKLLTEAFKSKKSRPDRERLWRLQRGCRASAGGRLSGPGAERRVYLLLPHRGFYGGVGLAAENLSPRWVLIEPSGVGKTL